ncbi:MAG: hypothetical protein A3E78_01925 [Alphaproteobacteria bacterium RIFCSPHIGHO2_12_FULL_63_12]|nr:MAG: hypothetical protein A3E78_01925 [Alphaproteobacteria bacterium RIFCSPHIGHO2_12_FULL_63_12]
METIFVRPAPGARVRDPMTKAPIPDAGLLVPNNGYWQRRILVGDVVVTTEAAAQPKPKSKE